MFAYSLSERTGVSVDEPERLLRQMNARTLNRWRAFRILNPSGFTIENERHIHAAILAGANKPKFFGYKPPRKAGPMTVEEVRQANRDAGY